MRRSRFLLAAVLSLASCKSHPAPAPSTATPSASGPLTDAELDAAAASLSCHDVHRADRVVRMTCGDESRNISLENLDRQLGNVTAPRERAQMAEAFLSFGAKPGESSSPERTDVPPLERLVPQLKSKASLLAAMDRFPPEAQGKLTIPFRPIAGDVVIALGIDAPTSIETVTSQHLSRWNVDAGDLATRAVQNLAARPVPPPVDASEGAAKIFLINSGDSFDAARLLVPEARQRLSDAVGGEAVFAIPDRDHLLAARLDDDAAVAALRARAAKIYRGGAYAITDELIRYSDGKFTLVP